MTICRVAAAALVAGLSLPSAAMAEMEVITTRYSCDRGVEVPAVYANTPDTQIAVIVVDGQQIMLYAEEAASGARYGWPSDGANYVWWTKGEDATLYWKEGGEEVAILGNCKQGQ